MMGIYWDISWVDQDLNKNKLGGMYTQNYYTSSSTPFVTGRQFVWITGSETSPKAVNIMNWRLHSCSQGGCHWSSTIKQQLYVDSTSGHVFKCFFCSPVARPGCKPRCGVLVGCRIPDDPLWSDGGLLWGIPLPWIWCQLWTHCERPTLRFTEKGHRGVTAAAWQVFVRGSLIWVPFAPVKNRGTL